MRTKRDCFLRVQHWQELINISFEFRSEEDVHKVEVTHEKPAKFVDKVCYKDSADKTPRWNYGQTADRTKST